FTKRWYIIKAIVLLIRIIIAIGTAVWSPAIPTSGVAIPPPKKGNIPRKADALPAILPLRCIPKEKLVVFTIPTLETTIKSANKSEEHTSELQSRFDLVCRLLLEKKKKT